MKRVLLLFIYLALICSCFAQKETKSSFSFKLKGHVKTDVMKRIAEDHQDYIFDIENGNKK